MGTYRAAYLTGGNGTVLTGPEHSGMRDDDLISEALAEAMRGDIVDETEDDPREAAPRLTISQFHEQIEIGDWTE